MNDNGGIFPVSKEELQRISNPICSNADAANKVDFVQYFPPELSNKLFSYISEKDLFACATVSISWRHVINNDSQWKLRCIRRAWASTSSTNEEALVWSLKPSHVSKSDFYKFRTSPLFCLPEIASLRISPLCDWAIYFRQCFHVKRNWNNGIYVVHRLVELDCSDYEFLILNNDFDCDGKHLVYGTSSGKCLVWSVEGVPKFLACISPKRRVEIESVTLKSNYLIILYHTGLIKVFDTRKLSEIQESDPEKLSLAYQMKAIGTQSVDGFEFNLRAQCINEYDRDAWIHEQDEDDVEIWIRELFRLDLWGRDESLGSDMMIYANSDLVFLTGLLCKCFLFWDIHNGKTIHQITLQPGFQVIYQGHVSKRKLYLSTKKRNAEGNEPSSCFALIYDISSFKNSEASDLKPLSIAADSMIEEIRSDSKDERVVYSTQDGILTGIELEKNTVLFNIHCSSFVDNLTVSDLLIVYHKYDGFLVGINWAGESLYEVEAHIGLVKGLQLCGDILVSGGDAMQLCVWNAKTGSNHHTVHHQPCRIQHLYADETKIITVGREDPPVLIAYW